MPKQTPVVLEPDVDDFCYLFAQGIMRLLEEEDAPTRGKPKRPDGSYDKSTTELSNPGTDSKGMPIDH